MNRDASLVDRARRSLRHLRTGPRTWLVLLANRLLIAGVVTAAFAAGVLALLLTGVVDLAAPGRLPYLFASLTTGNLTLLTIVLSINQLVLSREFNAPDELRERVEGVVAFRTAVEETTAEPTAPVTPAPFLRRLLAGTEAVARSLRGAVASVGDGTDRSSSERAGDGEQSGLDAGATDLEAEVDDLVDAVVERTERSRHRLEASQRDVFGALVVVLEVNFSRLLRDARRIRTVYADDLDDDAADALEELIRALQRVDVARQYFKSIYMQAELARLSRLLLWVGLPAVVSAVLFLMAYASGTTGSVPPASLRALVPVVAVLNVAPLAVLFAFVLRVAAVAQRTVAITPFTTVPEERVVGE